MLIRFKGTTLKDIKEIKDHIEKRGGVPIYMSDAARWAIEKVASEISERNKPCKSKK